MFWNIDVKEQEQDLMAISHFLLSVFEFAADQPGNVFLKEDWLAFAPENGAWFYRLYERDTENGKNMHRAVDRLFRMEQEQRERIWRSLLLQLAGTVFPDRYLRHLPLADLHRIL